MGFSSATAESVVGESQGRAAEDRFLEHERGAALVLILQAAVNEGLAAGFLGAHAIPGLHDLLGIPAEVEVVGVVTVGHPLPDRQSSSLDRGPRPAAEVTHREHWSG